MTEAILIKRINGIQPIKKIMIDQKKLKLLLLFKIFLFI